MNFYGRFAMCDDICKHRSLKVNAKTAQNQNIEIKLQSYLLFCMNIKHITHYGMVKMTLSENRTVTILGRKKYEEKEKWGKYCVTAGLWAKPLTFIFRLHRDWFSRKLMRSCLNVAACSPRSSAGNFLRAYW